MMYNSIKNISIED